MVAIKIASNVLMQIPKKETLLTKWSDTIKTNESTNELMKWSEELINVVRKLPQVQKRVTCCKKTINSNSNRYRINIELRPSVKSIYEHIYSVIELIEKNKRDVEELFLTDALEFLVTEIKKTRHAVIDINSQVFQELPEYIEICSDAIPLMYVNIYQNEKMISEFYVAEEMMDCPICHSKFLLSEIENNYCQNDNIILENDLYDLRKTVETLMIKHGHKHILKTILQILPVQKSSMLHIFKCDKADLLKDIVSFMEDNNIISLDGGPELIASYESDQSNP